MTFIQDISEEICHISREHSLV